MKLVPVGEVAAYIGRETGRSEWFVIDQDRIDKFADVTEDRQWIHIDTQQAATGPFGTTIAHGFLTLSLLSYFTMETSVMPEGAQLYINYGLDKVRFLNPVASGSKVRAIGTLKAVTEKSQGQLLITNGVVVEIAGQEKPALVADVLTLAVLGSAN